MQNTDFWKNRKVLITGHNGFVGTWLSMVLQYMGAEVCGASLETEKGSLYDRVQSNVRVKAEIIDIREKKDLIKVINDFRPEVVFHLAAFGFIQECLADPETAFSTNTAGTYNVLDSIAGCDSAKSIIVASSDKVYKNEGIQKLFTEEDELGGIDPYSASKTCEDIIAKSYYESYLKDSDVGMCIVRPSNILGGGDHHENRLIPSIFIAFDDGNEPVIRNPQAVRPWQDILDMCDAYLFLAERAYYDKACDIVNVGPEPGGVCTVGEISAKVGRLFGKTIMQDKDFESAIIEQMWLGLSIEKIKVIGWSPKMTIDDTLENVLRCYKCDSDFNLYDVCMKQIAKYYGE